MNSKIAKNKNMDLSNYRYRIEKLSEDDGGGFFAYYPTLGKFTIYGVSDTSIHEALEDLKLNAVAMIQDWIESGLPVPPPSEADIKQLCGLDCGGNYGYAA
jgi:predicted RNase H-like HicB family nuclease